MYRNYLRALSFALGLGLFAMPLAFAYADSSASVTSLSPGQSVAVGQSVTFDISTAGFTNPYYTLTDNFGGSSVSRNSLNSGGVFSWTPTTNDIGEHDLTILVDDSSGDAATLTQTLYVAAPTSLSVQSISPGTTVNSGQALTFTLVPTGITSPAYSVSDSFSGSTATSNDISGTSFDWTPQVSDAGTHTITVTAAGGGASATASETITVTGVPTVSISGIAGATFTVGTPVDLTILAQGFSSPTYSLADSFSASTLNASDIATNGTLVWTPQAQDVGNHSVTFYVNDSSDHSANASYSFSVAPAVATTTALATTPATTSSSGLTPTQASAIISLLQSFGVDQTTINTVATILAGGSATTVATTPSTPAYTFTEYLQPGSQDNEVLVLQNLLAQQGLFTATPNGYFGPATEAAVIAFQAAQGIDQLGVVGPSTRAALNAIESGGSASAGASTSGTTTTGDGYVFQNPINPGDSDTDVTELQQRLTDLGIYSGPITSYYGDLTTAAVEQFQTNNDIEAVGYVGPQTLSALNAQ